ncbi:MAG TPA: hypothetical protein VGV35_02175 [Bryobacteraceae bacterium]|nr:hypothetical protein [Bryobacteraceae bacterium]
MRAFPAPTIALLIAAVGLTAPCQDLPSKEPRASETKGLPPRVAPSDYQAQAKAGDVTIAAEFAAHGVPVEEGSPLSTEDYVVVETAFFGSPGARLTLSPDHFSLRINSKKVPLPSQPFELVFKSLKDPEWIPPDSGESKSKSKTSLGGGGNDIQSNGPPPPVHVPIELRHAMELKVRRAALPAGERALPQAGLLFFAYHGKPTSITSLELIYEGPAGKATLTLQP